MQKKSLIKSRAAAKKALLATRKPAHSEEFGGSVDGQTNLGVDAETNLGVDAETNLGVDAETNLGVDAETNLSMDEKG